MKTLICVTGSDKGIWNTCTEHRSFTSCYILILKIIRKIIQSIFQNCWFLQSQVIFFTFLSVSRASFCGFQLPMSIEAGLLCPKVKMSMKQQLRSCLHMFHFYMSFMIKTCYFHLANVLTLWKKVKETWWDQEDLYQYW